MREKIAIAITIIGLLMTMLGFCSLDSDECFKQVLAFTIIGLALFGVGGYLLQIFD